MVFDLDSGGMTVKLGGGTMKYRRVFRGSDGMVREQKRVDRNTLGL